MLKGDQMLQDANKGSAWKDGYLQQSTKNRTGAIIYPSHIRPLLNLVDRAREM